MNTKVNPFMWVEIYVDDMNRAKKFYETVFQLKFQQIVNPELEMWSFPMELNKVGCGGALVKMQGVKPGFGGILPYFHCEDVVVEQARVEKAGGKIFKPKMSIGQYGFISLVYDTEGNMIGLHMPSADMKQHQ